MRRSKSNPAKYARNYSQISQRQMTSHKEDEGGEIERLRNLISKTSSQFPASENSAGNEKNKKRQRCVETVAVCETSSIPIEDEFRDKEDMNINYTTDDTVLVLPSTRPSKQGKISKSDTVTLTAAELKAAKISHKKMQRKLLQLEQRRALKERRTELYKILETHAMTKEEAMLMTSSATLGNQRLTKREALRKLLKMERAGIELSEAQRSMLYLSSSTTTKSTLECQPTPGKPEHKYSSDTDSSELLLQPLAFPSSGRKKEKTQKLQVSSKTTGKQTIYSRDDVESLSVYAGTKDEKTKLVRLDSTEDPSRNMQEDLKVVSVSGDVIQSQSKTKSKDSNESVLSINQKNATEHTSIKSLAQHMLGSLTSLKDRAEKQRELLLQKQAEEDEAATFELLRQEEEERKNRTVYTPSEPIVIKTIASLNNLNDVTLTSDDRASSNWRVLSVNRPTEITEARYNLPVSAMEYEIIDSIRNHSVTIVCSETGSGKSTQVPQFLYESGITLGNAPSLDLDNGLLIGVTQPRRVATISTAKRVSYEMGHSNDKSLSILCTGSKANGNLVAYQTRYESAGLGSQTRIKFMTDGILLQEIRSDLLLRKYAAIILDEAHERNLNTDVLLGLLSAALPLRKKASDEGSLPPLKVIIMSATLRVEDFVGNKRLFQSCPPNIVKVSGRTFPVTIHHSKITELDDYEDVAFKKVCNIHKKLPSGGILVFLTGKQEIIRMIKRLHKALVPHRIVDKKLIDPTDHLDLVTSTTDNNDDSFLRELDDEEADGDLFQNNGDEAVMENENMEDSKVTDGGDEILIEKNDNMPKDVMILPLYSLLSPEEQARVFNPVPEGTRLIVVATNVAETSVTIPNIKYVVDSGRQKCRNYHAGTGVASYDVMWISQASADQRAGRAGRTGPGHCYRLYSSSVYARSLDPFSLPEVLNRPLEDIVLAMKAMKIANISSFPFPTLPDTSQLKAAVQMLANLGCLDLTRAETEENDGVITKLGEAVAKLPLGIRYGKILLVASQANVLDYGITMVAAMSESTAFVLQAEENVIEVDSDTKDNSDSDSSDRKKVRFEGKTRWSHKGGDVMAAFTASGAYSYARLNAGSSQSSLCRRFCEENGLHLVVMERIHKLRLHLARLVKQRLVNAQGIAATTGGILCSTPPNQLEESLLQQAITSGLLDNIAKRSPPLSFNGLATGFAKSSYLCCRSSISEPLFIDRNSVLYSRDYRQLPEWICFDSIVRKTTSRGESIMLMKNVTPIDPSWLGVVATESSLLSIGSPLDTPSPIYDRQHDVINCYVLTKYGHHGWLIPPVQKKMSDALTEISTPSSAVMDDDCYRWFARFILEGKVIEELKPLRTMLNDDPAIITRKKAIKKVALIVSLFASAGIQSLSSLINYWKNIDAKFIFKELKSWIKKEYEEEARKLWINVVKERVK